MQPDNISGGNNPVNPQASKTPSLHVPSRSGSRQQVAVANLARQELTGIYSNDPNHTMPAPKNTPAPDEPTPLPQQAPTERSDYPAISHGFKVDPAYVQKSDDANLQVQPDAWKKYHSAWQSYYQEYYHRYYAGYVSQTNTELQKATQKVHELESKPREMTANEASEEIKNDIRSRIAHAGKKVRRSRHFVPIASAVGVMLLFVLLQYNTVITGYAAAYVSPGATSPSNIIVDPGESDVVSDDPRLIIPKIAVDVPVVYNDTMGATSTETAAKQDLALQKGVAWFGISGANSHPGQLGNTVLAGHSSNDWLAPGDYKFVFARLEQMKKGDVIYVNYQGTRYTYTITGTKTINPNNISALYLGNSKPMLTLITCTPVGTALNRFLVFAEQVSPAPANAKAAPGTDSSNATTTIPGNSPTSLQRLFGG